MFVCGVGFFVYDKGRSSVVEERTGDQGRQRVKPCRSEVEASCVERRRWKARWTLSCSIIIDVPHRINKLLTHRSRHRFCINTMHRVDNSKQQLPRKICRLDRSIDLCRNHMSRTGAQVPALNSDTS